MFLLAIYSILLQHHSRITTTSQLIRIFNIFFLFFLFFTVYHLNITCTVQEVHLLMVIAFYP
ncbi:hypothetical protein BD408DRAFT_413453 [Parasitella parasitica]|nr:hypothetical protein BD408DRAFT_413453 [Parasitella parasitica]